MAPKNPIYDQHPPALELEESSESESSSEEEESVSNKHIPPPEPETMEESSEEEDEESSEEEGEEGSEEEGVGESDVEEEKDKQKPLQILPDVPKQTIPPPQSPAYSGEEEEGEDEKSENSIDSPSASDFRIKAVTPPKPTSKGSKSITKRPPEAEKDDEKDSRGKKRAKVNAEELRKDSNSGGAGRVWGDENVIDLLQRMIDFKEEMGVDYSSNFAAFYEFVKGKLQFEFSNTQVYEKIRRLRVKFFNNKEKYEKGGEDLVFHKPHEAQAFDLSKKIWAKGGDGMVNKGVDESVYGKSNSGYNGKAKKSSKTVHSVDKNEVKELGRDDDDGDFETKYPFLSQSFDTDVGYQRIGGSFLREKMSLIGNAKAKDLEDKWKKLHEAEAEVLLMRMDLMKEHTKLVLEGMKKM